MLYWDNQKSLLHFLPVPPSGHRLPECIFPMSSQPVSHKGGNRRVKKKKKEKNTHTQKGTWVSVQPWASPKPDVIPHKQIEKVLGAGRGGGSLVTDAGDIPWVFKSVKEYCSRQADHAMENGVKGQRAGCGGYTHIQYNASITLWHTLFFFLLCTWSQFHPSSYFPPGILIMGGSNCALPGRPQGLPLCIWVHSPPEDFQMASPGQRWKHLTS